MPPRAAPLRTPALAAALLAACVDAGRPAYRATTALVRHEQTRAVVAATVTAPLAELGPAEPIPAAWMSPPQRVAEESGVFHIVVGALRVDVHGEEVTTAQDVTAGVIRAASRVARGWVFLTEGALYGSDTFTGRLRTLRSFGCARGSNVELSAGAVRLIAGRDRAGITDGINAWWTDGAAVYDAGADIVSIAWHDAAWGARLTGTHALQATHDGGASWRDVDLHGALAMVLSPGDTRINVATPTRPLALDAQDTVRAIADDDPDAYGRIDAQCWVSDRSMELSREATSRPYAVARPLLPPETCAQREARIGPAWSPPALTVRVTEPSDAARRDGARPRVASGAASRLGDEVSRSVAAAEGATTIVAVEYGSRTPPNVVVTLQWRGDDDGGAYAGRVVQALPPEVVFLPYTRTIGASRRGVLFQLVARPTVDPNAPPANASLTHALYWFTSDGVRRVTLPQESSLDDTRAVPTAEGGLVVLGARESCTHGRCDGMVAGVCSRSFVLYQLDASGAVRGVREVPVESSSQAIVGVGELDGRWGFVVASRNGDRPLTLLPVDGDAVPFGAWPSAGPVTACDDTLATARLHLFDMMRDEAHPLPVDLRESRAEGALGDVKVITFERASGALCLRRVWASRPGDHVMVGPEHYRTSWSPVRVHAHGGVLEGVVDEGARIRVLRGTVATTVPPGR